MSSQTIEMIVRPVLMLERLSESQRRALTIIEIPGRMTGGYHSSIFRNGSSPHSPSRECITTADDETTSYKLTAY